MNGVKKSNTKSPIQNPLLQSSTDNFANYFSVVYTKYYLKVPCNGSSNKTVIRLLWN
jgi:hypothetical protein